jgi:uncharacterized protein
MSEFGLDIAWDPIKAQSNFAKHGVSFAEAASVLTDPLSLTVFDAAHSLEEERWFTLGLSAFGRVLALAHTFQSTGPNQALARIISARVATRQEQRQYERETR